MALTPKQKLWTRIGVGAALLGGGIWAAIYFIGKSKEQRAGEEGGAGEPPVSPCVARPTSAECLEEKRLATLATGGRGNAASPPVVPPAGIGAVGKVIIDPALAKIAFCNKIDGMTRSEVLKALGRTTDPGQMIFTSVLKVQLRLKSGC